MRGVERIAARFAALKAAGRGGFVPFVTAGDPDHETSLAILKGLPGAGADLVELGMPFSDPMADGPAIQLGNQRALRGGQTLGRTLAMARAFREGEADTPLILMGYFNPIYSYGSERFVADAAAAGADGLIVVDLPPEEDQELRPLAEEAGLAFVRLATPTSDEKRLDAVLSSASGFLYYVSVLGITGTRSATDEAVRAAVKRLKARTDLPVAVGFGIRTREQAAAVAAVADAAVVGSAIVQKVTAGMDADGRPGPGLARDVLEFVAELADAAHGARPAA